MGALKKQLELIDKQSMAQLVQTFGEVAKAADTVFADIKSHWYTFGIGATGAKHALDDFQSKYDNLIAKGDSAGASDLLRGTKKSAEDVLRLQQQAANTKGNAGAGGDQGKLLEHEEALNKLKASGVGFSDNEVKAQQTLVDALNAQVGVETKVNAIKAQDKGNATKSTGNEMAGQASEAARQAAEHKQKMGELALAAEREQAQVSETLHQSSIAARLAQDIAFADKDFAIQVQGNRDLAAALDKAGKDYNNQLAANHARAEEITRQHENAVAVLTGKAQIETYRKSLEDMEASERAQIEATGTGTSARLAIIDAAIRNEQSLNLQATAHYKELLTQRVEVARQSAEEEAKLRAEYGRIMADDAQKMGELALAAEREQAALRDSAHRMTAEMRLQEEIHFSQQETALKMTANAQQIAALDKGGKDYENKLKELQNKQKQLIQAHENEITAIKTKAEIERNQRIMSAENQYADSMASSLTKVLTGQQSFASAMRAFSSEVVSGLMQAEIKHIEMNLMSKQSDAAAAARKAYLAGMSLPAPGNMVAAPIFAAGAYAGVMAFQGGTDYVPGVGRGDTVPAMLTPGEGVVPGGVMDGLRKMASSGNMGGGDHYHAHVSPTYHLQALRRRGDG